MWRLSAAVVSLIVCDTVLADSAACVWYRPPPPDPHPKFMMLPVTAGRPVAPIPAVNRETSIARLSHADFIELAPADCRALGVPFVADKLIDAEIDEKENDVRLAGAHLKRFPLDGSEFDSTYYATLNGIEEDKKEITHLKSLKGRVRPYLVRAVAANDFHEEFYASFWEGAVTVTHRFEIDHSANDPLHSHASIGDIAPENMVKWPIVVYLEAPPTHIYTTIHVLKLGG
jgi:hypothetical protein